MIELKDLTEKSGFQVIAAVAEHSIMHQYAAGRPDLEDKNELQRFARKILEKINRSVAGTSTPQIPGNYPYKKAGRAGLVPKADKKCPQSSRKVNGAMVSVAALAIKKACSSRKGNELYI